MGDGYGWLGGFDSSGELRCILPYTVIRKAIIRMIRFRVETIPLTEAFTEAEEKAFLNSAADLFRSQGAAMIMPATTNTIFRTYPDGAVAAPYGSFIVDLTQDETMLFGHQSSSHRRKVRLAEKQDVKILYGIQYLEIAYHLVRETFKRSDLPFMGLKDFKRYITGLGENVRIFVAEFQGVVQGCLVVPFSQFCAYYVYGGSIPEPVTGATNLLHWEAIRHFLSLGVERYDFVGVRIDPEKGSKQEGLKNFKERFGGRMVKGYMWKMPLTPWKYKVYSQAVHRLRGGDIVDQERRRLDTLETSRKDE
ncbi:MAG: peptidoglycan bridge formation glycyltransferase FemA/FemB family protein [Thermodesulfobacteriota bacterium]